MDFNEAHQVRYVIARRKLDPIQTRIGDNFLLYDLMFCNSMIQKGYGNVFSLSSTSSHTRETLELLGQLLNLTYENFGAISTTYGYISPDLSRKIVRWKNPNDPSYHRWDDGAAVDIVLHDSPRENNWEGSPACTSLAIQLATPAYLIDRIITYSESEGICVAVPNPRRDSAKGNNYYYTYEGVHGATPKYIRGGKLRDTAGVESLTESKVEAVKPLIDQHGWRGQGYPSYHGGGVRQYHHVRLGKYLLLSDTCRNPSMLTVEGRSNRPPTSRERIMGYRWMGARVNSILEQYYAAAGPSMRRVSMLCGHNGNFEAIVNDAAMARLLGRGSRAWNYGGFFMFAIDNRQAQSLGIMESILRFDADDFVSHEINNSVVFTGHIRRQS